MTPFQHWPGSGNLGAAIRALLFAAVLAGCAWISGESWFSDSARTKISAILLSLGGILAASPLIQKVLPEVRTYFITLLSPLVGVLVFFDLTFLKSGWRLAAAVVWSSLAFVDI
jgi:hypothetical protein